MPTLPQIVAMIWHGMPPELNTARLMAGAGEAPMIQAAAGWGALAIFLETQADELAGSLAALSSTWSGTASERAVSATMPMVIWLRTTALQAQKRAMQATSQASSYATAMATTPPIPEIEENHITHAVLEATNFLGINTVPWGERGRLLHPDVEPGGLRDGHLSGGDGGEHAVRADSADDADRHSGRR